ncbi:hypothetical protein CR203_10350 [Salipaludibacillus neizhouensis]|uniref:Thioredoxin domain-containing protein n=1 Tax=Salipaludibacillus neizhouensis TaxID=885475 RepID=A0A3A9K572_9BACI|nr:TlpA disulfide reductase family protein [Salipaludibacillus neizhouensis]RKL67737.1 hypothetical protein CR203_10350 [Salipaludibacillus neizhouensis]
MFRQRIQWLALCLMLFIGGAFYLQSSNDYILVEKAMSSKESEKMQAENMLSGFQLPTLEGSTLEFEELLGEKTFIFFFASWCHVCAGQWEEVLKVEQQVENVNIIAINLTQEEENTEQVKQYLNYKDIGDVQVALDEKGEARQRFGVIGIPTSFLINKDGEIETRSDGFMSSEQLLTRIKTSDR